MAPISRLVGVVGLVSAAVRDLNFPLGGPRNIVAVNAADDFCIFLPPNPNETIAQSEGYPNAPPEEAATFAVSFCTKPNAAAVSARLLPDGTITGAHFAKTDVYAQVTGTFNASIMQIPLDGGGYYDLDQNVNSPPGGICADYDSFYNSVNPIDGIYCIRCCKGISACNIQNGGQGCSVMVPGNYSSILELPLPKNTVTTLAPNSTGVPKSDQKSSAITAPLGVLLTVVMLI